MNGELGFESLSIVIICSLIFVMILWLIVIVRHFSPTNKPDKKEKDSFNKQTNQ